MSKSNRNWTREETIVAFNVYCKIPFKNSSKSHPLIIEYAKIINRSPSALNMKIGNIGRLDPQLRSRGVSGLKNGSKLDEQVWDEFNGNWDDLSFESEKIIANLRGMHIQDQLLEEFPEGKEKQALVKRRINQSFFRSAVLSAYDSRCCITGMNLPELLVASHIIPWSKNIERTNPRNGLCLNSLHDKAFDKGLITIDNKYQIILSKYLQDFVNNEAINAFLIKFNQQSILLPDKFLPDVKFLEYHYEEVFKR